MTRTTFRNVLVPGALIVLVGFAQGASILATPDEALSIEAGQSQSHPTQGTFWRPAESIASRPALELAARYWQPEPVSLLESGAARRVR